MLKSFDKWQKKQNIPEGELSNALDEIAKGKYEASLGGNLIKKRMRFKNAGKSGSGRTIVCIKKENRAFYLHGFSKNEQEALSKKELIALKAFAKELLSLSDKKVEEAINAGEFMEVK